jgi:hypothetical protein
MGPLLPAFNLTFGKGSLPYQDVMWRGLIHRNATYYNIPSVRGSHSDNSGM